MLLGEKGYVVAKMMELIVKICEAYGCGKLVKVNHVHVSGVSYSNIGEHGLEFIADTHRGGAKASVFTTTNPTCVDLSGKSKLIDSTFTGRQMVINRMFEEMGFQPTYSCIPYFFRKPSLDEHLSWGESSAVIYANSIYGARTNREGGPLTLASSLTGFTYYYGMHLDENRVVETIIELGEDVEPGLYGALGYWVGENINNVPMLRNVALDYPSIKILLAAAAATGNHALVVIENLTPQGTYRVLDRVEKIRIDSKEIEHLTVRESPEGYVLGYVGCPHLDPLEFNLIIERIKGRRLKPNCRLLVSVPYLFLSTHGREIEFLRRRGVEVVVGTCPIVSRLTEKPDFLLTNSGKAFFYMKNIHGVEAGIASIDFIVNSLFEKR